MCAFDWLINKKVNKDKTLIDQFPQNWWHPINSKFGCYRL